MWKNQSLRIAFTLPTEGKAISQYWNGLLIVKLSEVILKVFFKTFHFLHFESFKFFFKFQKGNLLQKMVWLWRKFNYFLAIKYELSLLDNPYKFNDILRIPKNRLRISDSFSYHSCLCWWPIWLKSVDKKQYKILV